MTFHDTETASLAVASIVNFNQSILVRGVVSTENQIKNSLLFLITYLLCEFYVSQMTHNTGSICLPLRIFSSCVHLLQQKRALN